MAYLRWRVGPYNTNLFFDHVEAEYLKMTNRAFKLMNILMSDEQQFLGSPGMLVHSSRPFRRDESDSSVWRFDGPGTHDFTTFFNAISVAKWKRYTVARDFHLHLEVRGAALRVMGTRADSFSYYSESIEGCAASVGASDDWQAVDLALPAADADVIEAFKIECEGTIFVRDAYYYANVDETEIRPVELALCTTTFKKEQFIERNIGLIKRDVLGSGDLISQHFHMHVVDNGRTLDVSEHETDGVTIHPNDNVGGAGGFARGMIEAMRQEPKATHVLLMDDDVLISPESIIRTFNLLSLVNDEYREAFVSGAMMNMDEPYLRWEEMGFMSFYGACRPVKPIGRMDVLHDVVDGEAYDIPSYMPKCEDQEQLYAAWWYCVIPMTQIERNGLPLPIFVRGDDVEYSRRCKPKFMTMNSVCIWHLSFHLRYNAAQERYQMTRNCFINQFTTNFAPLSDFVTCTKDQFELELRKFNYDDAQLILDGLEDFLKGPEWLASDEARTAFLDANKRAAKLEPLPDVARKAAKLGVDLKGMSDWMIWRDLPYSRIDSIVDRLTLNGQRFTSVFSQKGKVAVIDNLGWQDPRGKLRGVETIVSIDIPNRRGAIRHMDRKRMHDLCKRFSKAMKELASRDAELKEAYAGAKDKLTSLEFWKGYLGIE